MGLRLERVGFFVNDLGKMVVFYRDVLGFQIDWDCQGPYAEFQNDGVRFSMYERSQLLALLGRKPDYPKGLNGAFELAIDLPTSAEADQTYQRVVNAGGTPVYAPRDEPWGMHSAMIADPEGNLIEIGSWNRGAGSAS